MKNMQNVQNVQNMQNMHNMHNMQSMQNTQNMQSMQNMKNMQNMQNMQNIQNMMIMQIMQNMVKMHNNSFSVFLPLNFSSSFLSVLHLTHQNVMKSKVQCLHSISRTCLSQEFGLVTLQESRPPKCFGKSWVFVQTKIFKFISEIDQIHKLNIRGVVKKISG